QQSATTENTTGYDITLVFPSKPTKSEKRLPTSKPIHRSPELHQILKDLDMSNFDLSTEKPTSIYLGSNRKTNHLYNANSHDFLDNNYRKTTTHHKPPSDGKFTLSIHKFFREGLSTSYLKNVPKLLR